MGFFTSSAAYHRGSFVNGLATAAFDAVFVPAAPFLKNLYRPFLLLVTGPFKINGVPLRRVNAAYVIATSTRVEGVDKLEIGIKDKFFARTETEKKAEDGDFIDEKKKKTELPAARKEEQKKVDSQLRPLLKKEMKQYLNAKFSLRAGQFPHNLKF